MYLDLNRAIPKYFTQAFKLESFKALMLESFKTPQLRLLTELWCRNERANAL